MERRLEGEHAKIQVSGQYGLGRNIKRPALICAELRQSYHESLFQQAGFMGFLQKTWPSRYWYSLLLHSVSRTALKTMTLAERYSHLYMYDLASQYRSELPVRQMITDWAKVHAKAAQRMQSLLLTESEACILQFFKGVLEPNTIYSVGGLLDEEFGDKALAIPMAIVCVLESCEEDPPENIQDLIFFEVLHVTPSARAFTRHVLTGSSQYGYSYSVV